MSEIKIYNYDKLPTPLCDCFNIEPVQFLWRSVKVTLNIHFDQEISL